MRLILNWLLSALALMIVGYLVPGVHVRGVASAFAQLLHTFSPIHDR